MKTSLQTFGNNISTGFSSFGDYCMDSYRSLSASISEYFESKDFEADLDSIIDALHAHTDYRPDFSFSENFKERIQQKKDFLVGQAGKMIAAGALSGAWAAIESGNIPMIGEYTLVGAAGAMLIIVVTATGIIVKRVSEKSGMNYEKSSKAVEIFKSKFK